ncbi:J domain-containing protein [Haloplanus salinarum]|uniref:J domain-containing protein n=1 Tax=Haloplanus salinarum TaxID=1912324 RepID=UPI00214C8214|nr:J domain-containing protein [Haloplanus salinarum]
MSRIDWPAGFERTTERRRTSGSKFQASLADTTKSIAAEMDRMGVDSWRASTGSGGAYTKSNGLPKHNANPDDPGFVLRWSKDGEQFAVACDKYRRLRDNCRAVYLWVHETRMRGNRPVKTGQDEFAAARLPSGEEDTVVAGVSPHDVLDVAPDAPDHVVENAYRERVQETHPDKPGGDQEAFRRVQEAREALLDE